MNGTVLLRVDRVNRGGGHPRHLHPALDLKILQAGLGATLVDGWQTGGGTQTWVARILDECPRVVVIKAETWCLPEAIACGVSLRRAGVRTIAIGQQVSHAMRAPVAGWREAFDLALAGEAELELLSLVPRLLAGDDTCNAHYWQRFAVGEHFAIDQPDALPLPSFSDAEMRTYRFPFPLRGKRLNRWAYVLTARGCPHRCRHCSTVVRKSFGERLRKRDPATVVDEVACHVARGADAISFEDDTLMVDRKHFLALCDELVRRQLSVPWIANARPDELDEERVAAAAAAGARLIKVGIESATPRLLEAMAKTRDGIDWKLRTEAGMERLKRHGIGAVGLFLIGLPTETGPEVEDSLAWARKLAPDYVQVQVFRSYPDIPWWRDLPPRVRDGSAAWHYGPSSSTAAEIPAEDLLNLQRDFYRRYYLRAGFVLPHLSRFWRHYCQPSAIRTELRRLAYMVLPEPSAAVACGVPSHAD